MAPRSPSPEPGLPDLPGHREAPLSTGHDPHESELRLAALRERGAHRFDPIRFRYIEALARRVPALGGEVGRTLDGRLSGALAAYGAQFDQACAEASQALNVQVQRFPDATEALQRLHAEGDFRGLHRLTAQLEARSHCGPLAALVRHINQHAPAQRDSGAPAASTSSAAAPPPELKALRHFRSTWARLGVDQQLTRSLAKAPENPGPLNSHLLMLRSLQLMHGTSPAYLSRFMAHVDALLWLEAASLGAASVPRSVPRSAPSDAPRRQGDKERKPGRRRSG